jgi:bifunctional non-homologous end joining protein LigD
MPKSSVPKSKRQYVQGINSPARLYAVNLPDAKGAPFPDYIEPLFATKVDGVPSTDNWVHEIKFDGYRLQVHRHQNITRCYTRREHDWSHKFPTILDAVAKLPGQFVIDGEAVIETAQGDTDFNELQLYVSPKDPPAELIPRLAYYAFDILYLDGFDLRDVPLIERKEVLRLLLAEGPKRSPLKYSEHLDAVGKSVFKNACSLELEGVVSKLKNGRYRSGRNSNWVKVTCRHRDTFHVAGIAYNKGRFDGIYLGQKAGKKLVFAGKVEHGFSQAQVKDLERRAEKLARKSAPFQVEKRPKAHWIEPVLLADVEYRRMTKKRKLLRHPSYKGLREDLMD